MDICLFAGGNTATGFVSFYHQLCAQARYTTILKGGPGVGKSTFMREAAQAFRQKGHPVSYYACSGDPDSLDAVMDEITGASGWLSMARPNQPPRYPSTP